MKGKILTITFRTENVDTEQVRELIEDNLGVEIVSIDESWLGKKKLRKVI